MRAPRRALDGVLLLDKPKGLSSNQALQQAKALLRCKKGGHTGTLDPAATGLLVLCFGEATKLAGIGLHEDKTYEACLRLGVTTDTGDAEGRVLSSREVKVSEAQMEAALSAHRGEITQVPPMYSALKHAGKPYYEYARAGEEIERTARSVRIHELTGLRREAERLWIRVTCSKGTYIRVLAEQIGEHLGSGAHLESLRRTRVGDLDIAQALTLEAFEAVPEEDRVACLEPPEILLKSVPSIVLGISEEGRARRGQRIERRDAQEGLARLHAQAGTLIGLAQVAGGVVQPRRILLPPAGSAPSHLSLEEQDDSQIQ